MIRPYAALVAGAGWGNGRRRSVCRSGAQHPHAFYTGITNWLDGNMFHSHPTDAAEVEVFTKAPKSLQEQVDEFKHIVSQLTSIDGHSLWA